MNRNDVRPRKATISLRIDDGIKTAARYYARQRQIPLADVIRDLLLGYVEACARENERAAPDLLGARPGQFTGAPVRRTARVFQASVGRRVSG